MAPTNSLCTTLEEKVAFLTRCETYTPVPERVEVVETHMSWVFLAGGLVYKLKKPVRYEFLDFSTIEARRLNCQREVELNRRLAPDVYRGAVSLVRQDDCSLHLAGPGSVVDWLVQMRRLPGDRMLDALIRSGSVNIADIRSLSNVLSTFYQRAASIAMSAEQYRNRFAADVHNNHAELCKPHYGLSARLVDQLAAAQQRLLEMHRDLLGARAAAGRIIDAHGDLRPEHICLTPEPKIIDCLEFNREFRLVDPVDELSYLAMECERLGDASIGAHILARYSEVTGDVVPAELVQFYKLFRTFLRARIAITHIADHEVQDLAKWRGRANEYLRLATSYSTPT